MTQKDYIAFAHMLKDMRPGCYGSKSKPSLYSDVEWNLMSQWEHIVINMSAVFKADNDKHKPDVFYKACGYVPDEKFGRIPA